MEHQLVIFRVAGEYYSLQQGVVLGILQPATLLPTLPSADLVAGFLNLRGNRIPVINLPERLGRTSDQVSPTSRVIVTDVNGVKVGLLVDAITEFVLASEKVPLPIVNRFAADGLNQRLQVGDQAVVMLNPAELLSAEEMAQLHTLRNLPPA